MNNNTTLNMSPLTMLAMVILMLMVSLQQTSLNIQSWSIPAVTRPDDNFIVKAIKPETTKPATLDAFTADLTSALVTTADQTDILPLTADTFFISEWWGDWQTTADTTLSTELAEMYLTETMSLELIPNESLWFMGDMNPYTDLLPNAEVEAVYLTHGWDGDGSSQALLFVTAADNGGYEWGGMIFTQTGFIR